MTKTFYEFFAGGGMARAGLGTEWQCLFANDICAKKGAAYAANWGADHLVIGDVAEVKASDLPQHADLAWASFPCQDLSLAGSYVGLQGERSGTFWAFWNLMKALSAQDRKPTVIGLENVYGALTSHDGKDFDAIAKALVAQGYVFGPLVIDGVHFVPQSRPRLFIIAVDKNVVMPQALVSRQHDPAWHPDAVLRAYNRTSARTRSNWRWWRLPKPDARLLTMEDIIEEDPKGVSWHSEDETRKLLWMMSEINRRKVLAVQGSGRLRVGTVYRRTRQGVQRAEVRFDGISGCLRTPSGGSSRQTIILVDGPIIRSRLLSPREAARLMGLDDQYKLPARYNDAYMLAGDGLVVPAVAHVARHVITPAVEAAHMQQDSDRRIA